jgi:hypothetical protein
VTLTNLFRLHAILAALYAVGLLLAPVAIIGLLSPEPLGAVGADITRLLGAALVLIASLTWGASFLDSRPARQVIARALLMYTALGLLITIAGQLQGTWGPLGWSNVISYLIFVAGYAYFLFVRPE